MTMLLSLRNVNLRTAALAARYLSQAASRLWRIALTLFHEVMGFIFLVMAAWGALWLVRTFRQFQGEGEVLFKIVLVGAFVIMMGSFGISSFWRARRISRTK